MNNGVGDPYTNWSLCCQASSNGFSATVFHGASCNVVGTVMVIKANGKTSESYTQVLWKGPGCKTELPRRAFLFSLANSFKHVLYRYTHDIYTNPTFGVGHDLMVF